MHTLHVDAFLSFTLAILLLFVGRTLTQRIDWLQRYSIPDPLVGGVLCAAAVSLLYALVDLRVEFELGVRDVLLLYFFAGIGLKSDVRTLRQGGRPLLVLTALAVGFILLQNLLGMAVATGFGVDPRAGLMTGSISLTGGVGTALAWAPDFVERLGIANALELGLAANMVGLIAACMIGGPLASGLMRRFALTAPETAPLDVGVRHGEGEDTTLDYYGVLRAWLWLNIALMVGHGLSNAIAATGLNLPAFVGALLAGILIRNLVPLVGTRQLLFDWAQMRQGLALISDICLGMFLTMALMGLQLWALQGVIAFVLTALALQILLTLAYARWVVFRAMGGDYEAAVVCSGFGGIALGSTATAVANMTAVARSHGAAHRAFIVVPLVCGFFIDIANALVINLLAR